MLVCLSTEPARWEGDWWATGIRPPICVLLFGADARCLLHGTDGDGSHGSRGERPNRIEGTCVADQSSPHRARWWRSSRCSRSVIAPPARWWRSMLAAGLVTQAVATGTRRDEADARPDQN